MTNNNPGDKDKKKYTYQEYYEMGIEAAKEDPRFNINKKNEEEGKGG